MGTVLNMRPDLFRAAVAGVPFVDVLTTMLDPTIPLTTSEWEVSISSSVPMLFMLFLVSMFHYDITIL
uniref:Prolyl endopeptidase-like n=1 Tax=Arundo donax TaxID=35708 RepID=A0A0A9DRY9_ARUDO